MAGEVGKIRIRVMPDTSKFREDLKRAIDRIERQIKANIEINPVVSRASLAEARKQIKRSLDDVTVRAKVSADLAENASARIKEKLDDIDAKATVNVDLDHGAMTAKMAMLTRPRKISVIPVVNNQGLRSVATALAALSGARVLGDGLRNVSNGLQNIDRIAAKTAVTLPLITSAFSAVASSMGAAATLVKGFTGTLPALLAVPGVLGGIAGGGIVLAAALKDTKTVLADLGPQFSALQANISAEFWARAAQPIRDMAGQLLPALSDELGQVATSMAGIGVAMASAISGHAAGFEASFSAIAKAAEIASVGIRSIVSGVLSVGEVGAQYLPQLAESFNGVAASFETWAQSAAASGQMDQAIRAAVDTARTLGDVLVQVGGIIGAVFGAASDTGTPLQGIADGLRSVNAALSGPVGQGALQTVFAGANQAMAALQPAISAIGAALASLAPTIGTALPTLSQALTNLISGLSAAAQSPALQGGLAEFFNGILAASQALAPALPALGEAFGAVASTAGQLLAGLGPVLAAAIQALAPVITQVLDALAPLIPILSTVLTSAINSIAPLLPQIVSALTPIVDGIAQLLPALMPLVDALVSALIPAIQFLTPIIAQVVAASVPMVQAALETLTAIVQTFAAVLNGDWSAAWEGVKSIVSTAASLVQAAVSQLMATIGAVVDAALSVLVSLWNDAWEGIKSAVASGISAVVGWMAGLNARIIGAVAGAGSWLINSGRAIIQGLIDGISSMAGRVKAAVEGVLQAARNLLPFSPAKEGPFSGAGWTLYSGRSIVEALATGVNERSSMFADAVASAMTAGQQQIGKLSMPGLVTTQGAAGHPVGGVVQENHFHGVDVQQAMRHAGRELERIM